MRMDSQTAASTLQVGWTDTGATSFSARWYERFSAWPSATQQHGVNVRGSSGATTLARTEVDTGGHIRLAMTGTSAFSTTVLTLGSWFRFEIEGTGFNSASSALALRIYSGDSSTPLETLSLSAQTTSLTVDTIRFGKFNGSGTVTSYWDSISANIGSSTPQGAYAQSPTANDSFAFSEGTTGMAPASAGDTFSLTEGASSFTSALATSDGVLLSESATETAILSPTDSGTLTDTSALSVALAGFDALKQGDSPADSTRLANQVVSWGGGLDASYVVAASSDTSDMTTGDKCVLYDSTGVPKENTLFEITSIGAPAFGFQNVFIYPNAAITPISGDVLAKVVPAGAAVAKNTGANDSLTLSESSAVSEPKVATDTLTLTDSSSLNTGGTDAVASDTLTLTDTSALSQAYVATDLAAVSDVSALGNALSRTDSFALSEGATTLAAALATTDAGAFLELAGGTAILPVGSSATYTGYTTETPPSSGNSDSDVWLAVEFYVTEDCNLTAGYYWQPSSNTNTNTRWGWLFQGDSVSGTAIAETDHVAPSGSGWQRLPYTTPVALTANTRYRMAVFFQGGGYAATTLFFDTGQPGLANGPLVVPPKPDAQGNDQNLYIYDSASPPPYPTDSFNSASYWVDVEVTTGGGPADVGNDTFTLSESSSVSDAVFKTATDSITFTEGTTGLLDATAKSASETHTLTDVSAPVGVALSAVDGLTITDAPAAGASAVGAADSGALTDVSALNAGGNATASDTWALSEASSISAPTAASETHTLSEVSSLQIFYTAVDSATLAELSALSVVLAANDSQTLTEFSDVQTGNGIVGNDSATLSEVSTLTTQDLKPASDTIAMSESAAVATLTAASDQAMLLDSSTGTAPILSRSDSWALAESALLDQLFLLSGVDSAAMSEASSLVQDAVDDDAFPRIPMRFPDLMPEGNIVFPEEV
jgi:epidermal growth factor receptor substrate 15